MAISLESGGSGSKPGTTGCPIERPSTKPDSGKGKPPIIGNNIVKPGDFTY